MKQPWFGDSIVLVGASYLGYVQWAVADRLPPQVKAMIPQVTESALTLEFLRKDGISLETPFGWGVMTDGQERRGALLRQLDPGRKTRPRDVHASAASTPMWPPSGTASAISRTSSPTTPNRPRWAGIDHRHRVAAVTVPVSSIGGWYDIFLPGQLRDFQILQEAGRPARLTVGPWTHTTMDAAGHREALEFGLAHARGEQPPERAPVRLYVMGEEAWRDFDSWPPTGYAPQRFHLQPDGALSTEPPADSAPDRYRYDPADPTPAVGGVRMRFRGSRSRRQHRAGGPAGRAHLHHGRAGPRRRGHRRGQRRDLVPVQPAATPTSSSGSATSTRAAARTTSATASSA